MSPRPPRPAHPVPRTSPRPPRPARVPPAPRPGWFRKGPGFRVDGTIAAETAATAVRRHYWRNDGLTV